MIDDFSHVVQESDHIMCNFFVNNSHLKKNELDHKNQAMYLLIIIYIKIVFLNCAHEKQNMYVVVISKGESNYFSNCSFDHKIWRIPMASDFLTGFPTGKHEIEGGDFSAFPVRIPVGERRQRRKFLRILSVVKPTILPSGILQEFLQESNL